MDKDEATRNFLYVCLLDIVADAVRGDHDAGEALEDDYWVQFITTLDSGMMSYGAFMLRVWQLRDTYRRGDKRAYVGLRKMRQALAFEGSTGEGTRDRHESNDRNLPRVQPLGVA